MDKMSLAALLFPNVTDAPEELEVRFPQRNAPEGAVITRMAPSPTGFVHLGNLVQGLVSERMAHQSGGVLFLRVEDTDAKREVAGAVEVLIETLKHYGIHFDEGATIDGDSGNYGPYRQRQRKDIYHVYAKKLVEEGFAYPCFCTEEELTQMRQVQEARKVNFGYYGEYAIWRDRSLEEIQAALEKDMPWVLRFRSTGSIANKFKYQDLVKGELTITENDIDQVLLKSDGFPTYNFANVVDDHLQGITHVVRGNEYLSSAPKYNRLYEAFGWEIPAYIHCPTITNEEHKKLSKRSGHSSYQDLIDQGFVSEAVVNFVALLGWSPDSNQEIFTLDDLVKEFDYRNISKSPAVFDMVKLRWMNGEYIKAMDFDRFYAMAMPHLKKAITKDLDLKKIAAMVKTRIETFLDIEGHIDFFEALPEYDPQMYVHKKMKSTKETSLAVLKDVLPILEAQEDFSNDALYEVLSA